MDEMDPESVELGRELRQVVEPLLAPAPVVTVLPVRAQPAQPVERHTLTPVAHGLDLGPPGAREAVAEVLELFVRDADAEGCDGFAHGRTLRTCRPGALG